MIDIHTHILPYVDDGSSNINQSIELIKYEINEGVTDVFVTPHYFMFRGYISTYENNKKIFNNLIQEVKKQNLNINLHLGNEIFYTQDTLKYLNEKRIIPLGNSKYVLIEFSLIKDTGDMPEAINDLTAVGYIPIIAHPERYKYLTDINDYLMIKKMGAKIQINVGAILGEYGNKVKKGVFKLIEHNLVDFVASDIHDFRKNGLKKGYGIIKKKFTQTVADKLFNNSAIFE